MIQKELIIMNKYFNRILENINKEIIFLCIGSNKIIGDSVGPRVGNLLKMKNKLKKFKIFGDMENPITANNIMEIKNNNKLNNKFIIVIDSAMGKKELIGNIYISNTKTKLGKALGKNLVELGDISIKACVCENLNNSLKNYYQLKKVKTDFVEKLAEEIVSVICQINV